MFVFPSDSDVSSFLIDLQHSVSTNDVKQVARLIKFPIRANVHGKQRFVSRESFAALYGDLFTSKVRAALAAARFQSRSDHACVFWNSDGMMVGDGELWFNAVEGGVRVVTINN